MFKFMSFFFTAQMFELPYTVTKAVRVGEGATDLRSAPISLHWAHISLIRLCLQTCTPTNKRLIISICKRLILTET